MKKGFCQKLAFLLKKTNFITVVVLAAMLIAATPVLAWFAIRKNLGAYAPVSSPESLYIGAGHRDIENEMFEDIRYLYFDGIDATKHIEHWDHVFCVYGKAISHFKIQLAYTTNNQFSYEIYPAVESSEESENAVRYVTHTATPETFYYTIATEEVNGEQVQVQPLGGSFLNETIVNGESLGIFDSENTDYHNTYGNYENVNKYAVPLYWQTTGYQTGDANTDFVNYYILRVNMNGKSVNDRETDIICIAAKSYHRYNVQE